MLSPSARGGAFFHQNWASMQLYLPFDVRINGGNAPRSLASLTLETLDCSKVICGAAVNISFKAKGERMGEYLEDLPGLRTEDPPCGSGGRYRSVNFNFLVVPRARRRRCCRRVRHNRFHGSSGGAAYEIDRPGQARRAPQTRPAEQTASKSSSSRGSSRAPSATRSPQKLLIHDHLSP